MTTAQIATIPGREQTLKIAVESLRHQVQIINIYPNSDTDGNKFKDLDKYSPDEIILICDDDIWYPPDFAATLIFWLEKHPGSVVTPMGKIMNRRPISSYYRDKHLCFPTFEENKELERFDIPGTCGMAFKKSTCPDLDHTYFKSINSDIWMGIYCKDRGIPCLVIPHKADWLVNLMPLLPTGSPTVYNRFKDNDKHMTDLVNERI